MLIVRNYRLLDVACCLIDLSNVIFANFSFRNHDSHNISIQINTLGILFICIDTFINFLAFVELSMLSRDYVFYNFELLDYYKFFIRECNLILRRNSQLILNGKQLFPYNISHVCIGTCQLLFSQSNTTIILFRELSNC
jgi:hypothetical protein